MITALWIALAACTIANLAFTMLAFGLIYRMVQRSLDALTNTQEATLQALSGGKGIETEGKG